MTTATEKGTPAVTTRTQTVEPPERIIHRDLAGRVASYLPARDDMTPRDIAKLADSLIGVGMRLAGIIHDEDPADAASLVAGLSPDRAWALPFVMAAMIDIEKTPRELFAWAHVKVPNSLTGATSVAPPSLLLRSRPRPGLLLECGTRGAWDRHRAHGEEPCDACWIAHRGWEADKKQRQRDRRNARRRELARNKRYTATAPLQTALMFDIAQEASNAAA
jgi:hypothetical protein